MSVGKIFSDFPVRRLTVPIGLIVSLFAVSCRAPLLGQSPELDDLPRHDIPVVEMKEFVPLLGVAEPRMIELERIDTRTEGTLEIKQILPASFSNGGNLDDGSRMEILFSSGRKQRVPTRQSVSFADPIAVGYTWYGIVPNSDQILSVKLINKDNKLVGEVSHHDERQRPEGPAWIGADKDFPNLWELCFPGARLSWDPYSQAVWYRLVGETQWSYFLHGEKQFEDMAGKSVEVVVILRNGLRPYEIHYLADFTKVNRQETVQP